MERDEAQFDDDGRDPQVVAVLKFHCERTAQTFCRDDVPPYLSIAEFWKEVEQRGELITCQRWLRWRRTMDEAVLHEIWRINKKLGCRHPFAIFMEAVLPAPLESNMTSSDRWMQMKRQRERESAEAAKYLEAERRRGTCIDPFDPASMQRAVDQVIRHHVDRLAGELGPDDPYIRHMKSTLPTAAVLPFPDRGGEVNEGKE